MFRFTRKPSSGSHSQYLAKTTHLVQSGNVELVQDVSVIAAYCDLRGVCTHASQVTICSHNTDEVLCSLAGAYTPRRSQYAAITLTKSCVASQVIICSHNTDKVLYKLYVSTLNQVCNFS